MIDSLESVIKHYEEAAEAEERSAKLHQRPDKDVKGSGKRYLSCLECAKEHRQLAEWLRELKDYREHEFCRYCEERDTIIFDEPCKSCKIRFVRKKVNADEDSD